MQNLIIAIICILSTFIFCIIMAERDTKQLRKERDNLFNEANELGMLLADCNIMIKERDEEIKRLKEEAK